MEKTETTSLTVVSEAQRLVNLVLRYLVAGGAAILAFGLLQGQHFIFLRAGSNDISLWLTLLVVLVCGTAIYALHQAVLYRLVFWVLACALVPMLRLGCKPTRLRTWLLERRIALYKRDPEIQRVVEARQAECHFLYCSSWGISFAVGWVAASGQALDKTATIVTFIAAVLLLAALLHNALLISFEVEHTSGA